MRQQVGRIPCAREVVLNNTGWVAVLGLSSGRLDGQGMALMQQHVRNAQSLKQSHPSIQGVVLNNTSCCGFVLGWLSLRLPPAPHAYARSPRMRRASWMSLGMMVTRLAWMAHRLVSSNRPTR